MVDIQNSKITDRLLEETKAQPYFELPKKIMDSLQPVLIANPINRIFLLDQLIADSTAAVMLTTPLDKDTYVLSAQLSITKDVVSPSTRSFIIATPFGLPSKAIIGLMYEPLTAGSHTVSHTLLKPMKLQPGSTITITNSSGTASIDGIGVVTLMEVEVV